MPICGMPTNGRVRELYQMRPKWLGAGIDGARDVGDQSPPLVVIPVRAPV